MSCFAGELINEAKKLYCAVRSKSRDRQIPRADLCPISGTDTVAEKCPEVMVTARID